MDYTVKKLSQISRVTIRTLHFYEEIGILKPAYHGSNGYRYYGEKELLQLQQILFFKELGFTLREIKKVLGRSDFDQLAALYSHKKELERQREKTDSLIKTIDKTINHINGKVKMSDQEKFNGFTLVSIVNEDDTYFDAEKIVVESVINPTKKLMDASFYEHLTKSAHQIFKQLLLCMERGDDTNSPAVQEQIQTHYQFVGQIHHASKKMYLALAQLYLEHPAFRGQLDPFHPRLAEFMGEAMELFAKKQL